MPTSTLRVDLRVGESVRIGQSIVVTLDEKSGQRARLSIEAPTDVRIESPRGLNIAKHAARGIPVKT